MRFISFTTKQIVLLNKNNTERIYETINYQRTAQVNIDSITHALIAKL